MEICPENEFSMVSSFVGVYLFESGSWATDRRRISRCGTRVSCRICHDVENIIFMPQRTPCSCEFHEGCDGRAMVGTVSESTKAGSLNFSFGEFGDMFRLIQFIFQSCSGAAVSTELTVRGLLPLRRVSLHRHTTTMTRPAASLTSFGGDQDPSEISVFRKICMKFGLTAWDEME
jgi:hypothetical protein